MWIRTKPGRHVPCRDIAGRRRAVRVRADIIGRVIVVVPPGEVAQFTADEVQQLWAVLRLAVLDAAGILHSPAIGARSAATYLRIPGTLAVPCLDAVGRDDRAVTVTPTTCGRVVVSAPAGGCAVLTPLQVGALRGALRDAANQSRPMTDTHARPSRAA